MRRAWRGLTSVVDPFVLALLGVLAFAALLPARGAAVPVLGGVTDVGIALLFFLYGARLSRQEVIAGVRHWRLHLAILALTFVAFPLLGLAVHAAAGSLLPPLLLAGLLFLTLLPSTIQSQVSFCSIAHGNVAATICTAAISNLLGVLLTPALVLLLMGGTVVPSWSSVQQLVVQLLLPFAVGQVAQRWVGDFLRRHRSALTKVDRVTILLVVYSAFSAGMRARMWTQVSLWQLALLLALCLALFVVVSGLTAGLARLLRMGRADRVSMMFAGPQKSMATGLPMAAVLFAPDQLGILVIPLMAYHQLQLIVCAQLARHWGARTEAAAAAGQAEP